MKTQEFIARTSSGKTVTITAENTGDGIKTPYPVKLVQTPDGAQYAVTLTHAECKELFNFVLPKNMEFGIVLLADQDGWRDFDRACARERYDAEEDRLNTLFPGLREIQEARAEAERYHAQFERMMEDENNDGANPPRRPKVQVKDLLEQYPKAAAYLKAKGFAESQNLGKLTAGQKALTRLEAGEEYQTVITDMEQEWSKYIDKHIWD